MDEIDTLSTCDQIILWFKEQATNKNIIPPDLYLRAASNLNVLKGDEIDRLIDLKQDLAVKRAEYVEKGGTSAAANIRLEADPVFSQVKKQESKIETIKEQIRLGKLWARLKNDELNNARFGQT